MSKFILLSFDVEEFDIPLEYQYNISTDDQMKIDKQGLNEILPVVESLNI